MGNKILAEIDLAAIVVEIVLWEESMMDLSFITRVFYNRLFSTILILIGCIAGFFFIRIAVKFGKWPKWTFAIWAVCTILIACFTIKGVVDLHCDIKEESFVSYQGDFMNRGGSQRDLKTIVIYDDSGREMRLLSGNIGLDTGNYTGIVVYGRRLKIVVQITPDSDFGK